MKFFQTEKMDFKTIKEYLPLEDATPEKWYVVPKTSFDD
jgi:hypothetical protein